MGSDRTYEVWYHDDAACASVVRLGGSYESELTGYGGNDFVLDFLVGSGLWGVLTSMKPDGLRKENGKPWRALNGVEVLRELLKLSTFRRSRRKPVCGVPVRAV